MKTKLERIAGIVTSKVIVYEKSKGLKGNKKKAFMDLMKKIKRMGNKLDSSFKSLSAYKNGYFAVVLTNQGSDFIIKIIFNNNSRVKNNTLKPTSLRKGIVEAFDLIIKKFNLPKERLTVNSYDKYQLSEIEITYKTNDSFLAQSPSSPLKKKNTEMTAAKYKKLLIGYAKDMKSDGLGEEAVPDIAKTLLDDNAELFRYLVSLNIIDLQGRLEDDLLSYL